MARTASRTTPNLESQPLRGADFERAHSSVVLDEDVRDRRRGFTIVELLIVVVVIAILAAITIVAYNGITDRAHDSAVRSDLASLQKKMESFRTLDPHDLYPSSATQLRDAGVSASKGSYPSSGNGFLYCRGADGQSWAFVALSRSKSAFSVSSFNGIAAYTGAGMSASTLGANSVDVCSGVMSGWATSGNIWGQNGGVWQSWVAG